MMVLDRKTAGPLLWLDAVSLHLNLGLCVQEIGEGALARVYTAIEWDTGELVACNRLRRQG